jgi:hypothetical protein
MPPGVSRQLHSPTAIARTTRYGRRFSAPIAPARVCWCRVSPSSRGLWRNVALLLSRALQYELQGSTYLRDTDVFGHRLAHVVHGERSHRCGSERLHLHARGTHRGGLHTSSNISARGSPSPCTACTDDSHIAGPACGVMTVTCARMSTAKSRWSSLTSTLTPLMKML